MAGILEMPLIFGPQMFILSSPNVSGMNMARSATRLLTNGDAIPCQRALQISECNLFTQATRLAEGLGRYINLVSYS